MQKRSTKWYRKNEMEVMADLGLVGTKNSGAGFIEKEDGYNEYILAQLKSTDGQSIKVCLDDIEKLEYHAKVEHKLPVFVIEFNQTNDVYILVKPIDLPNISQYLRTGQAVVNEDHIELANFEAPTVRNMVTSSASGKDNFAKSKEKQRKEEAELWQQTKKAMRRK